MFCKSCGKAIPDDSNFCAYCGISLSGIKTNEIVRKGMSLITVNNGKHIIFCEAKWCNRSDPIEINADSNEIHFSTTFPETYFNWNYKLILTKTKETEIGTWE